MKRLAIALGLLAIPCLCLLSVAPEFTPPLMAQQCPQGYTLSGGVCTVGGTPVMLSAYCTGVASASATLSIFGFGASVTACSGTYANGIGMVMPASGTATALYVTAVIAGVNASSGAFTLFLNDSAQALTCTVGTGTSCNDTTAGHAFAFTAGQRIGVKFTTQGSETLAAPGIGVRVLLN